MAGRTRLGAGLAMLSLGVFAWADAAAGQPLWPDPLALGRPPLVIPAEKHAMSGKLRDTPAVGPPETPEFREIPKRVLRHQRHKKGIVDPVLQSSLGGLDMPAPAGSFDGLGNMNGTIPPDTNGAVGPNHYVQWVNVSFAIYDKATGTRVYGPAAGSTLWQALGGPCAARNDGDPVVLYDQLAGRWVMSQFALPNYPSGPFYQCIAVSQTSDPTGAFYLYAFKISDTRMNDYPKLGVWPDAYYMTANQFTCSISGCNTWAGQGVVAFERAKMLAGLPAHMVYFDLFSVDATLGGMLPSDVDGPAPPAGTPNYFAEFDDNAWGYSPDQVQIWAFHVDWTTPANSTFTKVVALPTQAFDSNMCNYSSHCIPQPGTTAKVDALSDRFMYRLQYRNFGAYAALVANHTVDVDSTDHAGIRWYELRNAGSGWSIYQQGTYAPDGDHRWMGSIAMDKDGNIALGYSVSGAATYPSVRYTGRLATDPLGTLPQGETSLVEGTGSQLSSTSRWGDYSLMAVDPTDDCTFWYTQEYYASTTIAGWRTRIGSFKFASCGSALASGADLVLTNTGSPNPVFVGGSLTYSLTVTNNGPDPATNVTLTDTLPAPVTLNSVSSPQMSCVKGSTVTCTLGTLPSGMQASATVVVTPTAPGTISNPAAVSAAEADPNPANNSWTAVTTVTAPAPVVSACTPASGTRGATLTVAVTGANFRNGATAKFGLGVTVQSVTFVSSAKLNVRVSIPWWTFPGPRTVTITNPNGKSGSKTGCFTVN